MAWNGLQVQVLELFAEETHNPYWDARMSEWDAWRTHQKRESARASKEKLPPDERKRRWTTYNHKNRERLRSLNRANYYRHMSTPEGRAKLAAQARARRARRKLGGV